MTLFETLELALASDLLSREMIQLPARGATPLELEVLEAAVRRPLSEQHRRLLSRWNGADLGIIRIYGAGAAEPGIYSIEREAHWAEELGLSGPSLSVVTTAASSISSLVAVPSISGITTATKME